MDHEQREHFHIRRVIGGLNVNEARSLHDIAAAAGLGTSEVASALYTLRGWRLVEQRGDGYLLADRLTVEQAEVLLVLRERGPSEATEVAGAIGVDLATAKGALWQLRGLGLVREFGGRWRLPEFPIGARTVAGMESAVALKAGAGALVGVK